MDIRDADPDRADGPHDTHFDQWLLHDRFGGDPASVQRVEGYLHPVRDKILSNAGLADESMILDVGCGDGLIGFGALSESPSSRVIFSDISHELLSHVRDTAMARDCLSRCRFLLAPATDLSALMDDSLDVVALRSVLLFVDRKQAAFDEFYRVLKPGGRLSLCEGINAYGVTASPTLFGYDVAPVMDLARKILAAYVERMPAVAASRMAFDDRDLVGFAEAAGFREIHLELQVEVSRRPAGVSWEVFTQSAPHPDVPPLSSVIEHALSPSEAERFVAHLRPLVEQQPGIWKTALAYLWAVK